MALGPADPASGLMPVQTPYKIRTRIIVRSPYSLDEKEKAQSTMKWKMTIKNPCVDEDFVRIVATPIDPLEYIVGSGESFY